MHNTKVKMFLEKVLQSKEFVESQMHQKLLEYLVKASLDGDIPKDSTIAYDVFDADPKDDNDVTTKVRVYVHNLRKKLASYYIYEGKEDEIRFEIPKGHYKVVFRDQYKPRKWKKQSRLLYAVLAILAISMALNIFLLQSGQSGISLHIPVKHNNPVWQEYLTDDLPTLIVLGDYFLYVDMYLNDRNRYVRDFQINSLQDFETFMSSYPEYKEYVFNTEHSLLGKLAPWCLYELTSVLAPFNSKIDLKLSSQFQWGDLKNHNVIFVGAFKTLGILGELVKDLHFTYQIHPNNLYYHPQDADTSYAYHALSSMPSTNPYETDYAVIAKFPGPNNNVITIFTSTRDIGCLAAVDFLCLPQYLDPFIKNHIKKASRAKYFETILEVRGYERTVASIDLLHFNKIDSKP
jgi:hypothetical protein